MERHNTIIVIALAVLVLTLAVGNAAGWAVVFAAVPPAAVIIAIVAVASEVITANLAIELERNVKANHWPKVLGTLFLSLVFVVVNTVGTHNAWEMAEDALLGERRAAAEAQVKDDLRAAERTLEKVEADIDALPEPDPSLGPQRFAVQSEFYKTRYEILEPRLARATEAMASLPTKPAPIHILPPESTWPLFAAIEAVKYIGFWSLSSIGFTWSALMFWKRGGAPLTPAQHASALAKAGHARRRQRAAQDTGNTPE